MILTRKQVSNGRIPIQDKTKKNKRRDGKISECVRGVSLSLGGSRGRPPCARLAAALYIGARDGVATWTLAEELQHFANKGSLSGVDSPEARDFVVDRVGNGLAQHVAFKDAGLKISQVVTVEVDENAMVVASFTPVAIAAMKVAGWDVGSKAQAKINALEAAYVNLVEETEELAGAVA